MKKRIYALIEVKDRELLGKILFGLKMLIWVILLNGKKIHYTRIKNT